MKTNALVTFVLIGIGISIMIFSLNYFEIGIGVCSKLDSEGSSVTCIQPYTWYIQTALSGMLLSLVSIFLPKLIIGDKYEIPFRHGVEQ